MRYLLSGIALMWLGGVAWLMLGFLTFWLARSEDEVVPGVKRKYVTYEEIRRDIERRERLRSAQYPEVPIDTEQHTLN